MRELDPRIHVLRRRKDVEARDKRGHDDEVIYPFYFRTQMTRSTDAFASAFGPTVAVTLLAFRNAST